MTADRHNTGKTELSLLPLDCLAEVAKVLMYGAKKYDRDNWRKGQPGAQILDSLLRHVAAIQSGEERDEESGQLHSAHIATNALFLIWENIKTRDFYIKAADLDKFKSEAERLLEKYNVGPV